MIAAPQNSNLNELISSPNPHQHSMQHRIAQTLELAIKRRCRRTGLAAHAQILALGLAHDTFLANRLVDLYNRLRLPARALAVFRSIPSPNHFSYNAALSAAADDDLELALHLFDQMPSPNVVSYNTVVSALARGARPEDALRLVCAMVGRGIVPTNFTLASALSACGAVEALDFGRDCHSVAVKVGLDHNLFVENSLLGMYAKCGSSSDALKVFDEMSDPNEVSFTAMIGGMLQRGCPEDAVVLFGEMHRRGVRIDQVAVSSILGACGVGDGGMVAGRAIHGMAIKNGFLFDQHVGNSLVDMYAKCGEMENAELVFRTLPGVNVVSWNILIAGYGQMEDAGKAKELLEVMQREGFEPDEVTYISLLTACVKAGDVPAARRMFDKIETPNVTSWNAILSGLCQEENFAEAIDLFRKMQFRSVVPDRTTLALVLSSCSGMGVLEYGEQVHTASIKSMLHTNMFVASGLVDMYSKCGHIEVAKLIFDRMVERDVVSWNSMITGFAHHSRNREAFNVFKQMRQSGLCPTEFSYASVVNSCARLSSLPQGRQIHAQMTKDGHDSDVYAGSALIDMYARCGDVNQARCFFDTMPTKNVVSWNEMIHGYAQNGCGERALELFEDMLSCEGVEPNNVTFIAVLTACSHSGMVDEGLRILDAMEKDFGVKPVADHYTCVIDSLGRAGRLEEAEVIIEKMPCMADPILWEVLLSACAVHGNDSLGKLAAEQLFQIDPLNSAPYVLLSNIYASLGRWKDALDVRKMMSNKGIAKDRGYSWIDNQKGVRAFMVDDIYEDKQQHTYAALGS